MCRRIAGGLLTVTPAIRVRTFRNGWWWRWRCFYRRRRRWWWFVRPFERRREAASTIRLVSSRLRRNVRAHWSHGRDRPIVLVRVVVTRRVKLETCNRRSSGVSAGLTEVLRHEPRQEHHEARSTDRWDDQRGPTPACDLEEPIGGRHRARRELVPCPGGNPAQGACLATRGGEPLLRPLGPAWQG